MIPDISQALERIRDARPRIAAGRSLLVAVLGIDGSGKGYVTAQIVDALKEGGLHAVEITIDGWLNPPFVRFGDANSSLYPILKIQGRGSVRAVEQRPPIFDHKSFQNFSIFEQMGRFHPDKPHWYLPLIGVEPLSQGVGRGTALMKKALDRCGDLPAYLESTNERNIPFYRRLGFEPLGVIRAGDSPPIIPMRRN